MTVKHQTANIIFLFRFMSYLTVCHGYRQQRFAGPIRNTWEIVTMCENDAEVLPGSKTADESDCWLMKEFKKGASETFE